MSSRKTKQWAVAAVLSASMLPAAAQLRLPKIFGDSMVLQRDAPIRVWGHAAANETITVRFHNQSGKAKADAAGKWALALKPEPVGGPYTLEVEGKEKRTFKGILMGDVWFCSGQSNMEFPVSGWSNVQNHEQEIARAQYPSIRLFTVEKNIATLPEDDVKGGAWQSCSPGTISPFSAVGYFFGRALHQRTGVPIGLINSTWGGTYIEDWIGKDAFEKSADFKHIASRLPAVSIDSLVAMRRREEEAYIRELHKTLPDTSGSVHWKEPGYNDASWEKMELPSLWEQRQLGQKFDGLVWFRKEVALEEDPAGATCILRLGKIDDNEETYVNGVKIGGTQGYAQDRIYTLPAGVLKKGRNIIAVRVEDTGGGGGIYGDPSELFLSVAGKKISLAGGWPFRVQEARVSSNGGVGANDYPSLLYNAMVNPVIPFGIKGAIWYQGEANTRDAASYRKLFPLLIQNWRSHWKSGVFPFYFVQLSTFDETGGNSNKGSIWAGLREAQALATRIPNTGMAVTIDIGDAKDIHPRNKQDVGARLALLALKHTYGIDTVADSPAYQDMRLNGSKVHIRFSNTGSGLQVKPGSGELKGFEIAGADKKFYPATAVVKGNEVMVYSASVPKPVSVRYAWADDAGSANLFNKEGLPAGPFRTDRWEK